MMVEEFECKKCGASSFSNVDEDTLKCDYCGSKIKKTQNPKQSITLKEGFEEIKNNIKNDKFGFALIKFLVCIFFGYFGIHRFLEGKILTGLVFMFTGGIFGIGYFLDVFRLLSELLKSRRS